MGAMPWGDVELEPEVRDWFLALDGGSQARAMFHIDRLADAGPLLDELLTVFAKTQRREGAEGRTRQARNGALHPRTTTVSDEE